MTDTRVSLIDLYVLRRALGSLEILLLRRAPGGRCVGAWEAVHGRIEAGETPVETARRELAEETGFVADRLYNLSRVESFYSHTSDEIALIPVFVAFVPDGAVRLSAEHDEYRWVSLDRAPHLLSWPRERRAIADIAVLLGEGDAGPLEGVLLVG